MSQRGSRRSYGPPPWWPQDEPWPPRGPGRRWRRRRAGFMRRAWWFTFLAFWGLFWTFTFSMRWWQSGGHAGPGAPFDRAFPALPLLIVGALVALGVSFIVRGLSAPVAEIVAAADRIANRHYAIRVRKPTRSPRWVSDIASAFNAMAEQLEEQDEARRHLMADVAHELRTPLAVVQGKIEGLLDGVYPPDTATLEALLNDTRTLSRLVDDLRTLASAESGALGLAREPTDLVTLVSDTVASLEVRAREAGVALAHDHDRAVAMEPIAIDPVRIREVLVNLIGNAIRHTPQGGRVTVEIAPAKEMVEVRVVDTGSGIDPADLSRVFDRFYKGARSSGSGLGLTIARNLVEAHGGSISAESRPGAGTTVRFTLPR